MAYDIYMEIQGIKGDSSDLAHREWCEVLSYSHEVAQEEGALNSLGSHVGGKASHKDFVIVKRLDKASPTMFLYCCTGRHIQKVKIEVCRAMGAPVPFMKYTLKDVVVSSFKPEGSHSSEDMLPEETISLRYTQIELEYIPTDPTDGGRKGGSVQCSYDLRNDMEY